MLIGQPVIVQPVGGLAVKKPDGTDLAAGGEVVIASAYWQRRVADGSVTEAGGAPPAGPIGIGRIVIYDQLVDRASATDFGVGLALVLATKTLYMCDSSAWTGSVALDSNGDLVANIIPRTDTLNNLLATIGSAGELASATDQTAIVKFKGTTAGGAVFTADQAGSGTIFPVFEDINVDPVTSSWDPVHQIDFLSFGYVNRSSGNTTTLPIRGFTDGIATVLSYNGRDFFRAADRAADSRMATDGGALVAVPTAAGTTGYYCAAPFDTWTPLTGNIAATSKAMSQPVMITQTKAITIETTSGTTCSEIDLAAKTATSKPLPTAGVWTLPVADQYAYTSPLAISAIPNTVNVAVYINTAGVSGWVAKNVPAALGATPFVCMSGNVVLIGTLNSTVAYVASYDRVQNTLGNWVVTTLPSTISFSSQIAGNDFKLVMPGAPAGTIAQSVDGITWTTIPFGDAGGVLSVIAFSNGFAIQASANWFLSGDRTVSKSTDFQITAGKADQSSLTSLPALPNAPSGNSGARYSFVGPATKLGINWTFSDADIVGGVLNCLTLTEFLNVNTTANATLRVNLPPNPYNGQIVNIRFQAAITTLTMGTQGAPTGQTVMGAATFNISTVTARSVKRFIFCADNTDWSQL